MTTKTPKSVVSALIDAREIIKTRFTKGWGSKGAPRCAMGACREVLNLDDVNSYDRSMNKLYTGMTAALAKHTPGRSGESAVISFNDAASTSQQAVIDLFTKAIKTEIDSRK